MLSEHIYFNNNFCARWWNKTSGFKFVLYFSYSSSYSSCNFHFQNADNLSSRFSVFNHMNAGISPNCKFHLKYYFTGKTCWTRNIRFTIIYKGLRTHLCYTNAIVVNCIYFLYIGRETHRRKKKRSKRQVKVLLWEFLKFSILYSLLFVLPSIWNFSFYPQSKKLFCTQLVQTKLCRNHLSYITLE